ncbi:hypothetical protein ABET22_04675 [Paenibacillus chibensis]|nr:hypothetical protein [Paenibacillus chibensis]MEC0371097.1 hypothetical protein [Paenibacillus chibensis]
MILILGSKQNSYDGINIELAADLHFVAENDIWDFIDLERAIVTLSLAKIKVIYDFLQSDLIRIYSDLDVGYTPSGESTSMLDQLEPRPERRYTGCSSLIAFVNEKQNVNLEIEDKDVAYQTFYAQLAELPKITREFYFANLDRSEYLASWESYGVREPLLRRVLNISKTRFQEELKLLEAYHLASLNEYDDDLWIILNGSFNKEPVLVDMIEYIEEKGFNEKQIFVDLDFTCFS